MKWIELIENSFIFKSGGGSVPLLFW